MMGQTSMVVAFLVFLVILVGGITCSSSLYNVSEEYSQEQVSLENLVKSVRHVVRIRPEMNMPYYCAFALSSLGGIPMEMINMLRLAQKTLVIINTWPYSKANYSAADRRNCSECENIIVFAPMADVDRVISKVNVTCTGARIELLVAIYDILDSDNEAEEAAKTIVDFSWEQLQAHTIVLVSIGSRILALKSERHISYIRCKPEPPQIMAYWESGTFIGNLSFARFGYNKCVVRVSSGNCWHVTQLVISNGKKTIVGIEGRVLEAIVERQNYTLEVIHAIPPNIKEGVNSEATILNTTYVREKLESNEADIGVCSLRISYRENIKYSISYAANTVVLMIPIPNYIPFTSVLQTFSQPVWFCIVPSWIMGRVMIRMNRRSIPSLMALALFLGVSVASNPRGFVEKSQMILWVVYGYLITQSYIASLASVLNNPRVRRIETMEELATSDIVVAGYPFARDMFEIDDKYKRLVDTFINLTADEYTVMMDNPGKVFLDVQRTGILIDIVLLKRYSQLPGYYQLKQNIFNAPLGMAVMTRSRVSLKENDRTIATLIENGLLQKWTEENVHPLPSRRVYADIEAPSPTLSLEEVAGIFVILFIGWPLSIIVFIFEVYKKSHRTIIHTRKFRILNQIRPTKE